MFIVLVVFFVVSFGIFFLPVWLRKHKALVLAAFQLAGFLFFLSALFPGRLPEAQILKFPWIPRLGLFFEFSLDGLSLLFALLVTGIGALVFIYAHAYMKHYAGTNRFFFFLMLFSGSMLGLVLSSNLIQLFLFWELTSFLSFFLISFFHEKEASRKAAFQSLYITGFGGLCMLAGILLLGSVVGSYSLGDWLIHGEQIKESHLYLPGLVLILTGVFTKSAQFPFHFWLPGAMQAPAPVSSYLHSATMVKAGVFLLARLSPVLGGTPEWTYIISMVGVLTMLTGSYFAITQTDIKGILAYTTINALGVLVLLLGMGTSESIKAAMLFLIIHAFYKASLFMIAGFIEKKTGTRELAALGGLRRYMPFTFFISLLVLFSMAGLPPMLGFLGKELIYEAKAQVPGVAPILLLLGVTSNVFMIAVSLYFAWKVFLGKTGKFESLPNEKGVAFLAGPAVLALLSLVLGLFPENLGIRLIQPALTVVSRDAVAVKLQLWHGFNQVFLLSFLTIFLGGALFWAMVKRNKVLEVWGKVNRVVFSIELDQVFAWFMHQFVAVSTLKTRAVQHGYHRYYLLTVFLFASLLLWGQVLVTQGWKTNLVFSMQPFYISGLAVVILLAALAATVSLSRIVTIMAMGVAGYGIALIFLYYSAIDLAITQILVETLTLVMFMAILERLPRFAVLSSFGTRLRDLLIALAFGSVMTLLTLDAMDVTLSPPISRFFIENSYVRAFGENVVNVILVDFRAFDTLGEVTVLTIAAIGVFLLLKPNKTTNKKHHEQK